MKFGNRTVEFNYSKLEEINGLGSWIFHSFNEPAEIKGNNPTFSMMGSPWRRQFTRIFGLEIEETYYL